MSDDIRSFTCYTITITHNGARVDGEHRMTHSKALRFMNATNESMGVGIRYALTEKEAQEFVDEYNKANGFGFLNNMRFFNVEFVHDHSVHKVIISSMNTSVRPNTDITTERAITSIREAASIVIAEQLCGEGIDLDELAFNITENAKEINIEEVMAE